MVTNATANLRIMEQIVKEVSKTICFTIDYDYTENEPFNCPINIDPWSHFCTVAKTQACELWNREVVVRDHCRKLFPKAVEPTSCPHFRGEIGGCVHEENSKDTGLSAQNRQQLGSFLNSSLS